MLNLKLHNGKDGDLDVLVTNVENIIDLKAETNYYVNTVSAGTLITWSCVTFTLQGNDDRSWIHKAHGEQWVGFNLL